MHAVPFSRTRVGGGRVDGEVRRADPGTLSASSPSGSPRLPVDAKAAGTSGKEQL